MYRQIHHLNLTMEAMTKNAIDMSNQMKIHQHNASNSKMLEERLEIELSNRENWMKVLLNVSSKIQAHCDNSYLTEQDVQMLVC